MNNKLTEDVKELIRDIECQNIPLNIKIRCAQLLLEKLCDKQAKPYFSSKETNNHIRPDALN